MCSKIILLRLLPPLLGANELNYWYVYCIFISIGKICSIPWNLTHFPLNKRSKILQTFQIHFLEWKFLCYDPFLFQVGNMLESVPVMPSCLTSDKPLLGPLIPMYRLWLHSLYGLDGPHSPMSPERPLNLITHSLTQDLWLPIWLMHICVTVSQWI